jgi:hypothetical protein
MELFVHSPDREDPEFIEIEASALIRSLLVGSDPDGRVWLEDVDEHVELDVTLEQAGIEQHHHVHRGRCHRVELTVRFNGPHEREFGPATRIKTVHRWACGPHAAKLSPEQAAAHVLALPGADHFLEDGVHVGSLVAGRCCEVTLDLLPRARFEG